jgi:hypothetical protein
MTPHSQRAAPTQLLDTVNFAARDESISCLSYGVLRKLAGLPRDLFADYWRDVLGPLCARLPGVGYYDNAHPSPPSPHGDHQVSDERTDIGVIEIGFASALTARAFCESEAYRVTIDDQRRYLRSVGAFLVTGVYTYVRDGVITTAGLRGSRTAELIERIGAVNQTREEVTRHFVQGPHQ